MILETTLTVRAAQPARTLYWIPHDRYRYDYDDRDRDHSRGWAYNPLGSGLARQVARDHQVSMPEVFRFQPEHATTVSGHFDLLCALNPHLSRTRVVDLLGLGVAWCNTTPGTFDQPRICGGAVVAGQRYGDLVWIETLLRSAPTPTPQYVLENFLSYIATEVQPNGNIHLINRRGTDGFLHPARMILLTSQPIYVAADEVLELPNGFIPSPQWMPNE